MAFSNTNETGLKKKVCLHVPNRIIAFFMELSLKKLCFGTGSAFILLRIVCFRSEADFLCPKAAWKHMWR